MDLNYKIIAVDFDGTLCYSNWPELGSPNTMLIDYLLQEKAAGNNVILPYENTLYLIAFSYGFIHMKDFVRVNVVKVAICFLWALIIGSAYWSMIGLL